MKHITHYKKAALLVLMAFSLGCSNSDDSKSEDTLANQLLGTWKMWYSQEVTFEDGARNEHEKNYFDDTEYDTLEFKAHGEVTQLDYYKGEIIEAETVHYETHKDTLFIHWEDDYTQTVIFSFKDNELDLLAVDNYNPNGDEYTEVYVKQ